MHRFLNITKPLFSFYRKVALLALCTLYSVLSFSQTFPVQVIPQTVPPAPIYVSSYADASVINGPLRVQIILNDFDIANREIRLKTYFTGNGLNFQSNDFVVGASPLFLEGGIPLVLTNAELAPYFQFENITGISPNQYGNAIPEGAYQFCVEVYDLITGSRLSNKSCAVSVVFQNEPPFLVLPRDKTNVDEINPQYIPFQWTPRSINVSNVDYDFSIVEIWDTQVDPQQAFLSSRPIFETTTASTTYVYGPADPLLLSGKNYAWRVQAKAKQGTEEIGLFKNQGYSEIFSFSYSGSCDLPSVVNHEVKGSTNANVFWDDFSSEIPEYTVRYRKKGNNNEWFYNKTTANQLTLWDLQAGTTYEYQLQKKCAITESDWSLAKEFLTFFDDTEASVYECGINPDFELSNTDPLGSIAVGDTFIAGDFPIKILEVSGSNGRFTGKGYVTIPYLSSIRVGVKFTNVLINTDKDLAEGAVITMYDPSLKNILDIDEVIDTIDDITDSVGELFEGQNDLDEIRVNWTIDPDRDIEIVDGNVVITNPANGESVSEPLGDDKVVIDKDGKVYHIDAGGNVTEGGQIDPGGAVNSGNVDGVTNNGKLTELTAQGIKITFADGQGVFGFDEMPSTVNTNAKIKKEYTIIPDTQGNDYVLANQAVEKGKTTTIIANIEQTSGTYELSEIVFKTKTGEVVPSQINGNSIALTVKGNYTFENETIFAVVPSKEDASKQLTAGAFTLWHLTDRPIDVVLVSVDNAQIPSSAETNIRNIFNKGVSTINLSRKTASLNTSLLGSDNKLEVGDSALFTSYNDEQKAVISNIKSQIDYEDNKYYVLVFNDGFQTTKTIAGFMPLQRQFGFLFNKEIGTGKGAKGEFDAVAAHELGHGIFALQHPFTQYGAAEKSTNWLMDYKENKVLLNHMNWAQMHDPALKFYVFQDEEDGESVRLPNVSLDFKNPQDSSFTFLTIDGGFITLPINVLDVEFTTGLDFLNGFVDYPPGSLLGFTLDDKKYTAITQRNELLVEVIVTANGGESNQNSSSDSSNITKESLTYTFTGFYDESGQAYPITEENKTYHGRIVTFIAASDAKYLAQFAIDNRTYKEPGEFNIIDNYQNYSLLDKYRVLTEDFPYHNSNPFREQANLSYELTNVVLQGNNWNEKHLILAKYAELNNANPSIFESFFKENYSSANYPILFKSATLSKLKEDYIGLINYFIKNRKSLIESFKEYCDNVVMVQKTVDGVDYEVDVSDEKLAEVAEKLSSEQISGIDISYRKKAISKLLKGSNETDEQINQTLRLFKFLSSNQEQELLQFLVAEEYKNFWDITSTFEDEYLTDFMGIYTSIVNNHGTADNRIDIFRELLKLEKDDWGNRTEQIISGCLYNLESNVQSQQTLYTYFKNNPDFVQYAFETLDNLNLVNPLGEFVMNVSTWKIQLDSNESFNPDDFKVYAETNYAATNSLNEANNLPTIANGDAYIPYARANWLNLSQQGDGGGFIFETSFEDNQINTKLTVRGNQVLNNTYGPMDYVLIHFQEDSYYKGQNFKKDDVYIVPALFIHWLDDSVDDEQNAAAVRVIGNIISIAAAPFTFGGSTFLMAVDIGLAVVDIYITINRNELEQAHGQTGLAYWDALYGIYNLQFLPSAIKGIGQGSKSLFTFVKDVNDANKFRRFYLNKQHLETSLEAFRNLSIDEQGKLINSIDALIQIVKIQQPGNMASRAIVYRTLLELRAKSIMQMAPSTANRPIELLVEGTNTNFSPNLIIREGSTSITLGTIEHKANGVLSLANSNQWLPVTVASSSTTKVGEFTSIEFVENGVTKTGKVDIVEISGQANQFYLRSSNNEGGLANFPNIRSFLGDGRTLAYLNNQQLNTFENLLKTADPDVLKVLDDLPDADDFTEVVRGYLDNPTVFGTAIKSIESFDGNSGWLKAWKLTTIIKEGISTIRGPLNGKLLPIGNVKEIELATIQAFTKNGNFINVPQRYSKSYFGVYDDRAYEHMMNGMDELLKVPERKIQNQITFSGRTFMLGEFNTKFVGNIEFNHPLTGIVSSSKLYSVAEGFTVVTRPEPLSDLNTPNMVSVIYRIKTKEGIYIDDLSDWGSNLGSTRHADADPPSIMVQQEVIMKAGYFKQTSEPIKVMENGQHKHIDEIPLYYIDLEELLIPIN